MMQPQKNAGWKKFNITDIKVGKSLIYYDFLVGKCSIDTYNM